MTDSRTAATVTSAGLTRRDFLRAGGLVGAGVLLASTGCGGSTSAVSSGGATSVRSALDWLKTVQFAGAWVGLEKGYYSAEKLKVDYRAGGPNAPLAVQVLAGRGAQIGTVSTLQTLIDAIRKGNDFVVVGAQYQRSPFGFLSRPDDPVRTAEDLVGKRILGGAETQQIVNGILDLAGLPRKFTMIPATSDPTPLFKKKGDAYPIYVTAEPPALENKGMVEGRDFVIAPLDGFGVLAYGNLVAIRRDYLEANRDTVVRFMRATVKGWEANEKDPGYAARLVVRKYGASYGLSEADQRRENELQIPYMRGDLVDRSGYLRVDVDQLAGPMYDALRASGRTDLPDAHRIVDLSILDDVYRGKRCLLDEPCPSR